MHDDKIERSAGVGVWGFLSQPVLSCRPFYHSAVPPACLPAVVQRNICSALLCWFLDKFQLIDMVCFYIAVNTESGACTAPPERRGVLQAASLVVQVHIEGCLRPVPCELRSLSEPEIRATHSLRWSFG